MQTSSAGCKDVGGHLFSTWDTHQGRAWNPGGIPPPILVFPPLGPASWWLPAYAIYQYTVALAMHGN